MPRRALDFYETPPHYVDALLDVIGSPKGSILDPCNGRGRISNLLGMVNADVYTNDISPRRSADFHFDATKPSSWEKMKPATGRWNWVITNPPFSSELAIFRLALTYGYNVAMLARLSFLEPTLTRRSFWADHDVDAEIIVLPRYAFRKNDKGKRATDSVTCCWAVIRQTYKGQQLHVSQRRQEKSNGLR